MELYTILEIVGALVGAILLVAFAPRFILGLVRVGENEVGIVVKTFATKKLQAGQFIALNGEAGYQADTLSPGWHLWLFPWQYEITKQSVTIIPGGQLGLVMARDGKQIPDDRILARKVDCDNFQSARKFLVNGGQKGRQIGVLTAGTYRINTALFDIVTAANASKYGLSANQLLVSKINPDAVGIVTTLDGTCITAGEIAGETIEGHENFQNAQAFLEKGGRRGLQEQVLLSGTWNLNPWFAQVEQVGMTEINIGHVGVVTSFVGKEHKDVSGDNFKHGDLVERGHKGIWSEPLYPGKHPVNAETAKVVEIPTTNIALNWATNRSEAHKLDERLSSIKVRSKDGFSFVLDVTQIIHIGAKEASRVISRFGSMEKLVNEVLEPAVGNYFRNSAQGHTVLEFLSARSERQKDALEFIRTALKEYDIEAVDTYIGDIVPPESLMVTQTDRKIAEEQKKTFETQELAQKQRQTLAKEQAIADIQKDLVKNEQDVKMQDFQAQAAIKKAEGEAKAVTLRAQADAEALQLKGDGEARATEAIGMAKAKVYAESVKALGQETYGHIQIMSIIGDKNVKVTPDMVVSGAGGDSTGLLMQGLLAQAMRERKIPQAQLTGK